MRFGGAWRVRKPQHHATCVVSRRHFLVLKNLADGLFQAGQLLYEQQRFRDAARSWGKAALLQHAASHAFLSDMLFVGRFDVAQDKKRAFKLAAAGAGMGCVHSKGALGRCLIFDDDTKKAAKGLALARESAAAGSCFGQFVVGLVYDEGMVVAAHDYAEAVRQYRLAAAQGHADSQNNLGLMFFYGNGVAEDYAEAARLYRLAAEQGHAGAQINLAGVTQDNAEAIRWLRITAAQGHADAQYALGDTFRMGHAQDYAEAMRWYRLAAAQGHAAAQYKLGDMFRNGEGVAHDKAEALRWYRLAFDQGYTGTTGYLKWLRA
jgi:TPR repeat protein